MAVDRIAEKCGTEITRPEAQALTARVRMDQTELVLAKPQTFMNLSGLAIRKLLEKYEIAVEDLIVLVDEADILLGTLRIRDSGSAGSHRGLKSIIGVLESDCFVRIRMGVKPDHPVSDLARYVLRPFRKADLEIIAEMIDRAAEAVEVIVREDIQTAMNRYNRRASS